MKRALLIVLVVAAAAVVAATNYSAVRADLAAQRDAIQNEWSQVYLAIQNRAEQATRWVQASAGMAESAGLQEELAAARANLTAAATPQQTIRANQQIAAVLVKLQTIAAAHPKWKSNDLQARISDAENRIAVERRRYNDMLEHYNAQIQRFPDNIVASLAGFSRDNAYFPTEP